MNSDTTIIRKAIVELEKLDKFMQTKLPVVLRDTEIKGFFITRSIETPVFLNKLQRHAIQEWEPRVAELIQPLSMVEYAELRHWLGVDKVGLERVNFKLSDIAKSKLRDYMYHAKVILDLRNGEVVDASSTIRSA